MLDETLVIAPCAGIAIWQGTSQQWSSMVAVCISVKICASIRDMDLRSEVREDGTQTGRSLSHRLFNCGSVS